MRCDFCIELAIPQEITKLTSHCCGAVSGFKPLKMVLIWSAAGLPSLLNSSRVMFLAAGADSAATHTRATSALPILPALPLSPWAAHDMTAFSGNIMRYKAQQRVAQCTLQSSLEFKTAQEHRAGRWASRGMGSAACHTCHYALLSWRVIRQATYQVTQPPLSVCCSLR